MANKRIDELTLLDKASITPASDVLAMVDVSDSNNTKKVTIESAVQSTLRDAGVANGVLYLNGSKVATSGSALVFDGTKLTSGPIYIYGNNNGLRFTDSAGNERVGLRLDTDSNFAYGAYTAGHKWLAYDTEQMRLTSTGLGIGTSSPGRKLDVAGNGRVTGVDGIFFEWNNGTDATYVSQETSAEFRINQSTASSNSKITFLTQGMLRATLDGYGNLGLGVTPSAWGSGVKAIQTVGASLWSSNSGNSIFTQNGYNDGTDTKYVTSNYASQYQQATGGHYWYTAPSGTAGNAISFTQAMTLDASGNLLVGTTAGSFKINVVVPSGGNRDIAIFGVLGATNGVTIKWDQISSTIRMNFQNLPTSSAGLAAGDLWNDSGTLKLA